MKKIPNTMEMNHNRKNIMKVWKDYINEGAMKKCDNY